MNSEHAGWLVVRSWKAETPDGTYETRVPLTPDELVAVNQHGGNALNLKKWPALPPPHEWVSVDVEPSIC
jgi:hypothetical protein